MIIRSTLIFLVFSAAVAAATNPSGLSAQQIIDRNAAARGGAAAWQKIHSMTLAGKLDAGKERKDGGQFANTKTKTRAQVRAEAKLAMSNKAPVKSEKVIQLPFHMDLARPVKTRLEVPFHGETAVQVYDGKNGWKLRPYLGRHEVEAFTPEEMKIAASQQELDGALLNYKAKGTTAALEGSERVDGRDTYKLKLTLKSGDVRHVWIDAQTFLDVKIEGAPRRFDRKVRTVVTYYHDFKSVDGLMIAHRLETRIEGVPDAENIYIEKVALNPPINDSVFAKPL